MKTRKQTDRARHPVGVVTQRTGLTSHALRAWERRYGVVTPARTEGGHRLYTDADVERLRLLHELTLGGRQIGQIAGMSMEGLRSLLREDRAAGGTAPGAPGADGGAPSDAASAALLAAAFMAVEALDAAELDTVLRRAALSLNASTFLSSLLVPLMGRIGTAWVAGDLTPGHEHMASAVVRSVTGWLIDNLEPDAGAPRIVIGTPVGHRHELGAVSAAVTAASEGWHVRYLGPDLPSDDFALVAARIDAAAVALSLMYPPGDSGVVSELRVLAQSLPNGTSLLVGGRVADSYSAVLAEIGAIRLADYGALRIELRRLADRVH